MIVGVDNMQFKTIQSITHGSIAWPTASIMTEDGITLITQKINVPSRNTRLTTGARLVDPSLPTFLLYIVNVQMKVCLVKVNILKYTTSYDVFRTAHAPSKCTQRRVRTAHAAEIIIPVVIMIIKSMPTLRLF